MLVLFATNYKDESSFRNTAIMYHYIVQIIQAHNQGIKLVSLYT